ncbi:hypothetical protein [Streptomyces sp. NPDC051173]|uniref:hypothetical protein n=1 Tax=Streptomyces sp. NPDC051173 TaxID=3155164 RepID=UPI00344D0E63
MSRASMRRIAAVTASAALLSGIAAATGTAAFAGENPQPTTPASQAPAMHGHKGEHGKGDHGKGHEHGKGEHGKDDHGKDDHGKGGEHGKAAGVHLGWEKGVDKKKDRWDAKANCWQRYDADSRTYAQWDERSHCWKRKVNGHWQKWDTAHKAWK